MLGQVAQTELKLLKSCNSMSTSDLFLGFSLRTKIFSYLVLYIGILKYFTTVLSPVMVMFRDLFVLIFKNI